jgi:hypothetical protein
MPTQDHIQLMQLYVMKQELLHLSLANGHCMQHYCNSRETLSAWSWVLWGRGQYLLIEHILVLVTKLGSDWTLAL